MTAEDFKAWRTVMGLAQRDAALMLGRPLGTVKAWEQGRRTIPEQVALLCAKLLENRHA